MVKTEAKEGQSHIQWVTVIHDRTGFYPDKIWPYGKWNAKMSLRQNKKFKNPCIKGVFKKFTENAY